MDLLLCISFTKYRTGKILHILRDTWVLPPALAATSTTSKPCLCFPSKHFPGIIVGLILWIMGASCFCSLLTTVILFSSAW